MSDDDHSISIVGFDPDDLSFDFGSNMSISLGPIQSNSPPPQQDLFRHYITSHWIHSSHIADEDPQWQIEAWIKQWPHVKELYREGTLEIDHVSEDTVEYYHRATEHEHFAWRIRWSEQLASQKSLFGS